MKHLQPADDFPASFIVGSERSGTTLLATLIDRHPEIAVPPETHFFVNTRKRSFDPYPEGKRADLMKNVTEGRRMKEAGIPVSELSARFSQYPADLRHLFQAALETYAQTHNKRICAEKTPSHLFHVNRILECYPKARFIYIFRDGRDVVASLLKMPWRKNDSERRLIDYWTRCMELGFEYDNRLPDQWLNIQYETLVQNPEATLGRVMRFIGLEFVPSQLVPADPAAIESPRKKVWWHMAVTKEIDASQVQKWRAADPAVVYLRTRLMRRQLVRAGYTVQLDALPTPGRRFSLGIKALLWKTLSAPQALNRGRTKLTPKTALSSKCLAT
jgi:hypothetical protein